MIDSKLCPFCKKENKCQVDTPNSCWCISTRIPSKILEFIPAKYKNKACICKGCIELFKRDEKEFIAKYTL